MVKTEMKLTGDLVGDLDRFAQGIRDKVLISGAAAMGKFLYQQARLNAPNSEKAHFFYGKNSKKTGVKYLFTPGTLRKSIYRVYSPEKSGDNSKMYRVAWNHVKCPYGFMVEFGTSKAPAHPFLRTAFDQVGEAIDKGKSRMAERLNELKIQS